VSIQRAAIILPAIFALWGCTITSEPPAEYLQLREKALNQIRSENFSQAREILREVLSRFPGQPLNHDLEILLSGCERELGNEKEAYRLREKVASEADAPDLKVRAYEGLGKMDFENRKYDRAAERFHAALSLETSPTERSRLLYKVGLSHQRGGQFEKARKSYKDAIEVAPDSPAATDARIHLLYPDYFSVQTGAFSKVANAEKQKKQLSERGFPAEVVEFQLPKGTLHCVRVGNFRDRASALALRDRIIAAKVISGDTQIAVNP